MFASLLHAGLASLAGFTAQAPASQAWPASAASAAAETREEPTSARPKLVVVFVVDQMVPEHLDRLATLWTGGFARFARQGRRFTEAAYDYAGTETCPGHTTLGTGRMPWKHGIVANDWLARENGNDVYCVADPDVQPVRQVARPFSDGRSSKHIRVAGLADVVEAASPRSHTVTISTKDRAAIGLGGKRPDLALWWDLSGGGFMTSTWFAAELPAFVRGWNATWLERARASDFAAQWASALPAELDGTRTAEDARAGEANFLDGKHVFPYSAPALSDPATDAERAKWASFVYHTPLADRYVLELARRAVEELALGTDEHPDYLGISCSACDIVGHACGPYSREVTDLLLRDDRELEQFFALLDQRVGAGNWLAVLSADHGVLELPEALVAAGGTAGRVSSKELSAAVKAARAAVKERFGEDFYVDHDSTGIRFSQTKLAAAGVAAADVRRLARDAFAAAAPWAERVFTADEFVGLERDKPWPDGIRLQLHSFDAERSADVLYQPRPGWLVGVGVGTSHGTPHPYDRRVPLVFLGSGVAAGADARASSPADVVPTLLAELGLALPSDLDGRVLPLR
ncbi:MAG: alkaline phosphatase family protein [Planctomycetes bacterium]|nr:alkaline phosphatase family protein [Planctomycetota bacterium]